MEARPPAAAGELGPGGSLGPYLIEEVLGEGAMGVVYRAVHRDDGGTVALKVLRQRLAASDEYRARFLREARVAAEVEHPNLARVLEAAEIDGRYALVIGYVPGRTLAERLEAEGRLPLDDVLRLLGDLGAALDALHDFRLVHRDVKPANVVLDATGAAVLTDFGLAKGRAYTVLTRPGQLLGTVDYLAPEVIQGAPASPASDIYSLGCVAFACLAGRPPFTGASPFQVVTGHLGEEPPDPCAGRSDVPRDVGPAVLAALAKDPEARPPTARGYALGVWRAAAQPPGSGSASDQV
ncbi:MAG TPA: serine/threonine-protein kinase [Gaiellaceae bacterium]